MLCCHTNQHSEFFIGVQMLQIIFNKHLEKERGANRSNIKRSNQALLKRIATCLDILIKYNVGVDYYTPIYGNSFNINNKQRARTLDILKKEKIIEVKTNEEGKESFQSCWKYNKETKRKEFDNTIIPTPKSYSFTEYGMKLIKNKQFVEQIKNLTDPIKRDQTETITNQWLKKAAEDNLSLKFVLTKSVDQVAAEYLEEAKDDWHVTPKNYKYKFKEAKLVVLTTIHNFNNKFLKIEQRMYTALSLCPKALRKYIQTTTGMHIDEGFDINSSIYTLLGSTLELYMKEKHIKPSINFYNEKQKLHDLCFAKEHIYSYIGRWNKGHWTKEQIKPHNMQVVFSNNEDIQKRDNKKNARNQIKDFLQTEFPTIWSILIHFEQEVNEEYEQELKKYNNYLQQMKFYNIKKADWIAAGRIDELYPIEPKYIKEPKQLKSTIWKYFQKIETHIMLNLKHRIEAIYNTTAYWIHDCLCIEDQLLNEQFDQTIKLTFKSLIDQLNINNLIELNQLNAFNSNQNVPLLPWDSGEVELDDNEEGTESVNNERVIEDEDNEEKSEFEVLNDEINNLIEINIKKGNKNEKDNN